MTTFSNGESGLSVRTKINEAISHVDRLETLQSIVAAAGSTILNSSSSNKILVTGSTTHTIVLPDVTTLQIGWFFIITNDTTGGVTVQSSGLNTVQTIPTNTTSLFQCILDTGTTAASWIADFIGFSALTGSGSVVRAASPVITGTLTTAAISGSSYVKGGFTAHAAGTTAMALGTNKAVSVTPNASATLTTTVSPAGSTASIIVVTSGTTSYALTFGTGFVTTGVLNTGTVSGKTFVIDFVSDGTNMIEKSRTTAM